MQKNNIDYTVSRSFDLSCLTLLESLIEYMEDEEEIEDDEPPNSNCRDLLQIIKRW